MDIKDSTNNVDYFKVVNQLTQAITQLGIDNKKDIANIKSVIDGTAFRSSSIDRTKGIGYGSRKPYVPNEPRLITIQNPEGLNTNDNPIIGEWGITYGGRDLSLDVDNYCWIVTSRKSGVKGFYIVERELIKGDWLHVRWGRTLTLLKERKEVIDKKRLRDKDMIQRDMVIAVMNSK